MRPLAFLSVWDWYVWWRERHSGFYTAWEIDMLRIALALTRQETITTQRVMRIRKKSGHGQSPTPIQMGLFLIKFRTKECHTIVKGTFTSGVVDFILIELDETVHLPIINDDLGVASSIIQCFGVCDVFIS